MTSPVDTNQQHREVSTLTYAEAVAELETILDQLEQADIDVDVLSAAVERAAGLLKFCRRRINKAETRVREILADMEDEGKAAREPSPNDT